MLDKTTAGDYARDKSPRQLRLRPGPRSTTVITTFCLVMPTGDLLVHRTRGGLGIWVTLQGHPWQGRRGDKRTGQLFGINIRLTGKPDWRTEDARMKRFYVPFRNVFPLARVH